MPPPWITRSWKKGVVLEAKPSDLLAKHAERWANVVSSKIEFIKPDKEEIIHSSSKFYQKQHQPLSKTTKMASLVEALDQHTNMVLGENAHPELDWSNGIQERIPQLYFQCVRSPSESDLADLAATLDDMLARLSVKRDTEEEEALRKTHLVKLFKLIAQTRDVEGGKGEYTLAYMMVWTWYKYFPEMAQFALRCFVISDDPAKPPYGSWKDIKYMCKYILQHSDAGLQHPLLQYALTLMNEQVRADHDAYSFTLQQEIDSGVAIPQLSLAAKWVPRESSNKFGCLYESLATSYFKGYMVSAKTPESKERAINKCKAQYRVLITTLNRHLDTVQIKQAGGNWSAINHAKTTSITMQRQRKAFLNMNGATAQAVANGQEPGVPLSEKEKDREQCAANLREHLENLKTQGKEVKGKKVGLDKFAQDALGLVERSNDPDITEERAILDSQWRDNSSMNGALGNFIAMCDTSGSMSGDPINAAIGLSCRVAEKSKLGKRVMTFSSEPKWIDMDHCTTFTEMVAAIYQSNFAAGFNTDFYKALDMILTVIEQNQIPASECENMVLAIFSDMQMDSNLAMMNGHPAIYTVDAGSGVSADAALSARSNWKTLYETIEQKYSDVGMRLYGTPMKPPHILFWNLRKTSGFPTLSTQENTSMMSGFDAGVLNLFCDQGLDALRGLTGAKMLDRILSAGRYDIMEQAMIKYLG